MLQMKELTEELEDMIQEKCEKNGIYVGLYSSVVAMDEENDIIFIPGGGRGNKDEPSLLVMLYGKEKSNIFYEKYVDECLVEYEVVLISGIPNGLEKNGLYEMISQYFECYTEDINIEYIKNNPNSERYRVKVDFSRCEIYEKQYLQN